ncbi:MAG: CBS domain-containing protein [Planctomycetes bacterium]|nr:CBS domain-containing protein [Planctomycetota bacterium]
MNGRAHALSVLKLVASAALVGAIGGFLGVCFRLAAEALQAGVMGRDGSILEAARALPWWRRLATPALGGLVAGFVIHFAARRDTAFGISDLMEVVRFRRRPIRVGPTIARIGAALATISSGGSVGREGPIIQLGAMVANLVGRWQKADPRRLSVLLAAGAASGFAAAYNAPLAAAVFVMEAMLANFALEVFAPVVAASIAGTWVMRACLGAAPIYDVAVHAFDDSLALGIAALPLGIACGAMAVGLQRLLQRSAALFAAWRVAAWCKPAVGGLLVGAIGLLWPEVWGNGFHAISDVLRWRIPLFDSGAALAASVVVLLVMKPIATACSVGSGGQGGVFTPAMVVGAALGALLASLLARVPGLDASRQALVLVGMGGMIAGIAHAPIAAVVLLLEMTHHPGLLLPLSLCAAASALTARLLARDSLYTESLRQRGVPLDAGLEELALRQTRVGELMDAEVATVTAATPLQDVVGRFERERVDQLWVIDGARALQGVITLHDVKEFLGRDAGAAGRAVIAADLARRVAGLSAEQSLAEVLEPFDDPLQGELPVVDAAGRLVGRVTRRDVLATLRLEVLGDARSRAKLVVEDEDHARYLELPSGYELARLPITQGLAGRRLGDTKLRRNHGLVVLAIVRTDPEIGEQRTAFDPDALLIEGEQLVVMGRKDDLAAARREIGA